MKWVGLGLLVLIVLLALSWGFGWFGIFYQKTVGKEKQNVEREIFENTKSYQEGKSQELTKYRLEYMSTTDSVEKYALKYTILQSFSDYPEENLSPDLQRFLHELKE